MDVAAAGRAMRIVSDRSPGDHAMGLAAEVIGRPDLGAVRRCRQPRR
jgi:hypothetical protein